MDWQLIKIMDLKLALGGGGGGGLCILLSWVKNVLLLVARRDICQLKLEMKKLVCTVFLLAMKEGKFGFKKIPRDLVINIPSIWPNCPHYLSSPVTLRPISSTTTDARQKKQGAIIEARIEEQQGKYAFHSLEEMDANDHSFPPDIIKFKETEKISYFSICMAEKHNYLKSSSQIQIILNLLQIQYS